MIRYFKGSVFAAGAQTLVNTVNCAGVMGKGLALEFKKRFPDMYADYKIKCGAGLIQTGAVDYYHAARRIIVNFPTKNHYAHPARLEWIEEGLTHFAATYSDEGVISAAFPKLGTANGGLSWDAVRPLMEKYLAPLPIDIVICLNEENDTGNDQVSI